MLYSLANRYKLTRTNYRLPSEAEWEYACRAETITPFYFGETITDDLANYFASETYASEPRRKNGCKTMPVGQFPPNVFGLYDMHGNVWEWCLDPWHGNYKGAPNDGRAWDEQNPEEDYYSHIVKNIKELLTDKRVRVFRGGSCFNSPRYCRSAARLFPSPRHGIDSFGVRVVCVPPSE